ncbi:Cyclin-D-binding Myb-like transcription factor 1 [Nymphon striatum]|nr:Cyclin-D-binding Myb-like transcription factor 1 [Nymphon striatum]
MYMEKEKDHENEITSIKHDRTNFGIVPGINESVQCMSESQQIQRLIVVPQIESGVSLSDDPLSQIADVETKKMHLNEDGAECTTYILAVQPQSVKVSESLSKIDSEEACGDVISTAELTPAQQNAMAVYSDPSSQNNINQVWFTTKVDKSYLKNTKGQVWRTGMWSKEEIKILQNNIDNYCKARHIDDPVVIIFEMNKDERKDFYRIIAKGLNRPLFAVYRRVIRMYDNKNHIGKYTSEELEKLKMLRVKHGKDWQAIGQAMGRSPASIKDKCRLMKDNCKTGKWLPEEERRLAEAVYDLAQAVPGEIVYSGLSWSSVAARVRTRSEKQCRTKWLNYLNWKEVGGTEWTREDDMFLITKTEGGTLTKDILQGLVEGTRGRGRPRKKCLSNIEEWTGMGAVEASTAAMDRNGWQKVVEVCSLNAPDENAIDWAMLSDGWPRKFIVQSTFSDIGSVRSPQWLRGKWWSLKKQVPKEKIKNFSDLCEFLYKHHIQNVTKKESLNNNLENATTIPLIQDTKVTIVPTLPSSSIPVCSEVSLSSGMLSSSLPDDSLGTSIPVLPCQNQSSTDNVPIRTYTLMPSRMQFCLPGSTINSSPGSTIYLSHPIQNLTSGNETLLSELPSGAQQIVVQSISNEILNNVDKYTVKMDQNGQQVLINASDNNDVLQSSVHTSEYIKLANIYSVYGGHSSRILYISDAEHTTLCPPS